MKQNQDDEPKPQFGLRKRSIAGALAVLATFAVMITQFQNCAGSNSSFNISTAASSSYGVNLTPSSSTVAVNSSAQFTVTAISPTAGQTLNVTVGYLAGQAEIPFSPECVFTGVNSGATETCSVPLTTAGPLTLDVQVYNTQGTLLLDCKGGSAAGCEGSFSMFVAAPGSTPTPTPTVPPGASPTPTAVPSCVLSGQSCGALVHLQCGGQNSNQGSIAQCSSCCSGSYGESSCTTSSCYEGEVQTCNYVCH